ncbi:hypothetical protein ABZ901_25280 [Actinacidiphila alni]|uniref:hypothetical protein n=1 Tax=Actinacidiphila alni TaxID=380248 RepID=UPI0033E1D9E3
MNDSPEHELWLRPDLAERLLDGAEFTGEDASAADPRIAGLARLLAAADGTAPGRAADERAVLRAFAGEFAPVPRHRPRRTVRGPRSAKVLIGGAAAVFALGGAAIAAQSGALPHPFGSGGATPATSSAAPVPHTSGSAADTPATSRPAPVTTRPRTVDGQTPGSAPPSAHPAGSPAVPGLKGLCEAYAEAARQGREPDPSSLARLAQAAGGTNGIDAYCAELTGTTVVPGKPTTTKSAPTKSAPTKSAPAKAAPTQAPAARTPEPRPSASRPAGVSSRRATPVPVRPSSS